MKKEKQGGSPSFGGREDQLLITLAIAFWVWLLHQWFYPKWVHLMRWHPILASHLLEGVTALVVFFFFAKAFNKTLPKKEEDAFVSQDDKSVYLGKETDTKKDIFLKESSRTMHTQVIGTTNAGKTASVILPWAISDIREGRGFVMVDGKSDLKLLHTLYAQARDHGRLDDFLIFSLCDPAISATFNPFCQGTPEQITERVFSSFQFTEEYYKNIQFAALRTVISSIISKKDVPIPKFIQALLSDQTRLKHQGTQVNNDEASAISILALDPKEKFLEKYSGLVTNLGHFSHGLTAPLFNAKSPQIILSDCLTQKKLVYFQLPTMLHPFLGSATGKLVLQCLQSAISELQTKGKKLERLFSVYLDDFNDYIYPGFTSLLNKSRSANVGVVFSHQSLGDLEKVSPDFRQTVLTNTNVKIIMRSNDPDTAEYFAKSIGTNTSEATTSRRKKSTFGQEDTGEQSVRTVEEYIYHPNVFKSELGTGEGVVVIPHSRGRVVKRIQFSPQLETEEKVVIPRQTHPMPELPPIPAEFSTKGATEDDRKLSTLDAKNQATPRTPLKIK